MVMVTRTITIWDQKDLTMLINIAAIKKIASEKKKRVGRDYIEYLNKKLERIILGHIHIIGSRGTLKARDFLLLDEVNKR